MNDSFNIFEILSKDDKELSHSSVIKFLIEEEDGFFLEKLFGQKDEKFSADLEVSLDRKNRIDILLKSDKKVIAIENKFKCLPNVWQLESYSSVLKDKYAEKKLEKFLIYFNKGSDFNLPDDWNTISYSELYDLIIIYLRDKEDLHIEKKVLIDHYAASLKKYIDKYNQLKNINLDILKDIFQPLQNNKFWLLLMFHELAFLFDTDKFKTWVGSGYSYSPFINIHPPEWKHKVGDESHEFVIQLNGNNLKYYVHLDKVKEKQELVNQQIQLLQDGNFKTSTSGKFKGKISTKRNKTCFIYQEDILDVLSKSEKKVTLANIHLAIYDLIKRVNNALP